MLNRWQKKMILIVKSPYLITLQKKMDRKVEALSCHDGWWAGRREIGSRVDILTTLQFTGNA